jgi:hypothetical protein
MRQGNTRLDVFITLFKEQRDTCQDLQLQLTELELRDVFIGALNVEVFGMYKEEYYRDIPGLYPDTLNALFLHADAYYVRRCAAVPAMSHVLGDITGFAVYATYGNEEAFSQLPAPPGSPAISAIGNPDSRDPKPDVRPHCQLCDVPGHSALNCFSLRNPDTVKGYVDGVQRRGGRGGRGGRGRGDTSVMARPSTLASPSPTAGGVLPGVGAVFTRDDVFSAFSIRDTDVVDTLCSAILSEDDDGLTDFEHDDHADVHVIRDEEAAAFFESMVKGESPLLGFEENMRILASGRGTLVRDMGVGVYVKTAVKNLLSAIQLRKAYSCLRS